METTVPEGTRWYAVQCKGGESFRAAEHLSRQGYNVFHPIIETEKRRRGRPEKATEPLFPWYLFIQMDRVVDNWAPIRSTRGVLKLLAFGREPVAVPDSLIETLRQQAVAGSSLLCESGFSPGERVEITEGPFKDLEGVFINSKGEERVIVLLGILQREHRITLKYNQIRTADGT